MAVKTVSREREIFAKNLQRLMKKYNLTQSEVARDNGWSPTTVGGWLRCTKYPRIDKIQEIADYFNVSRRELLEDTEMEEHNSRTIRIPVLDKIYKLDDILSAENTAGYVLESPDQVNVGYLFYLRNFGKDMETTIPEDALVKIDRHAHLESGDLAAVLLSAEHTPMIRRIRFINSYEKVQLISDNPKYKTIELEKNRVLFLGKAISYNKSLV